MAQTTQSISHAIVKEAQSQYTASSLISAHLEEPKKEDALSIMFLLCDSVFNLCITLEKVHHILQMKNLELQIRSKHKGEEK